MKVQVTAMLKKETIPLVLTLIYCSVIFILSSIPGAELSGIQTPDYILHAVEYSVLGLLLCWWRVAAGEPVARAVTQAIIMGSLYGITDEFHQFFVPGRCMSVSDWLADTAGSAAGAWIFSWAKTFRKNSRRNLTGSTTILW
jgi:VanZ family protein